MFLLFKELTANGHLKATNSFCRTTSPPLSCRNSSHLLCFLLFHPCSPLISFPVSAVLSHLSSYYFVVSHASRLSTLFPHLFFHIPSYFLTQFSIFPVFSDSLHVSSPSCLHVLAPPLTPPQLPLFTVSKLKDVCAPRRWQEENILIKRARLFEALQTYSAIPQTAVCSVTPQRLSQKQLGGLSSQFWKSLNCFTLCLII